MAALGSNSIAEVAFGTAFSYVFDTVKGELEGPSIRWGIEAG